MKNMSILLKPRVRFFIMAHRIKGGIDRFDNLNEVFYQVKSAKYVAKCKNSQDSEYYYYVVKGIVNFEPKEVI